MAKRLKAMGQAKYQADGNLRTSGPGFALTVHPTVVNEPLRWRKPRKVFVNSMSDLFHPQVPTPWLADIYAVMAASPQHTFQVLTKRSPRARNVLADEQFITNVFDRAARKASTAGKCIPRGQWSWPLHNVWVGVSVETPDQMWRLDDLRQTAAAIRWMSAEPLLGALPGLDLTGVDWVVTGGESGPGARPADLDWFRDVRGQCAAAGVAFLHKQHGGRTSDHGGRVLDGVVHDAYPPAVE